MGLVVDGVNEQIFGYLRERFILETGESYELILDAPTDGMTLAIPYRPIVDLTTLERGYFSTGGWVADYTYQASEYDLDKVAALVRVRAPQWFAGSLRAVFTAGYATVPADVKLAVLEIMTTEWNRVAGDRLDKSAVTTPSSSTTYNFDGWPAEARKTLDRYVSKVGIL